ncbi:MAG: DUF4091 domain-containing protein [Bacillota bacterium]|nr:DUF4091 domain-containing protein [Bacillota bacterium]
MRITLKLVSALSKVMRQQEPPKYPEGCEASLLLNEVFSLQAAYCLNEDLPGNLPNVSVKVACELKVTIRQVFNVPVRFPCFGKSDDNYLDKTANVFPDVLRNIQTSGQVRLYPRQWDAFWLDVEAEPGTKPGVYPLKVTMTDLEGQFLAEDQIDITLIGSNLPKQKLIHTRWIHADSLASHYQVPMQSVEHNRILRNFISLAAKRGINMILTPIHTPPLDTLVNGERLTMQLVDVFKTSADYSFKFSKLRDFVQMCRQEGIVYFEMAHLFTQWGGLHAPKIMGVKDGSYTQLFGWDTDATSPEYVEFLQSYLPALMRELEYLDVLDKTYFHLTDEPGISASEHYKKLYGIVRPILGKAKILDALSEPQLLPESGDLIPVPGINELEKFENIPLPERWTYYCVANHIDVSNTFIAMPAQRTRILGIQLYLYKMTGFLHWAYNFYFSQFSTMPIDPYLNTDCSGFAPAGDAFQVYPGEGGQPEESLRLMLFLHAMQDLRALELLESKIGREAVESLIHEGLEERITMKVYPKDERWLLSLREKVNRLISQHAF